MSSTLVYDPRIAAIHKARVNVKSLAAEAKLIRYEERRAGPLFRNGLALHRRGRVREEARYAQLTLAFLRGRRYRAVESENSKPVDSKRLIEKIKRTWPQATGDDIITWLAAE